MKTQPRLVVSVKPILTFTDRFDLGSKTEIPCLATNQRREELGNFHTPLSALSYIIRLPKN